MNRRTLLVCDDDAHMLARLRRDLRALTGAQIYSACNGMDAARAIAQLRPDVAFLDMTLPGLDALGIMRRLRDAHALPRIVVMVEPGQHRAARPALDMGACIIADKHQLDRANLRGTLRRVLAAPLPLPPDAQSRLRALLLEVGIPRRLCGFNYISQAVLLALAEPYMMDNFSKYLYPEVARRYNTNAGCVERSIRHAIEAAWAHTPLDILQREFGNTVDCERGKPTNAEFIARMADRLRNGGAYTPGGD